MRKPTAVQPGIRPTGLGVIVRSRGLWSLALVFTSLVATLAVCEVGLRTYHLIMARWRRAPVEEIVLDNNLGWRATENYRFAGNLRDRDGTLYWADVRTDRRGFRVFGDATKTNRPKVLFLGDSFTHAVQVSAQDAYYSLVGRALDIEVFAYGAGGWGTLQELMILPDFLDLIQPDAVVLQLCSNDIYNNDFELERGSARNNNGLVRPYWEDGTIVRRLPRRFATLRRFASRYSEFLYFVFSRLDRIVAASDRRGFEDRVEEEGLHFAPFSEAASVTEQLLREIRQVVPSGVPVFAFCTDDPESVFGVLRSASDKAGLIFIEGVPESLRKAENRGVCTRAADGGHWSPDGHRVVAEVLVEFFEQRWSMRQETNVRYEASDVGIPTFHSSSTSTGKS